MLTTIHITVRDRVPTITAGEDVISHNSDYVAEFEFDEEWQDKVKTVYFVCEDGSYQAVVMSGNSCGVPMLDGEHRRIFVGVQAGAAEKPSVLKTTRPCCLKVKDSIADYLGQPIPDPTPDVYEQIIAMLNNLTAPTWDSVQDKPFSTLGSGLVVDENGVLSAQGGSGGSANAVQYVAQELTDEQKAQARENIGAGTSSFSGSYNDLTSKPTIPTQVTIDSTLKQSGQAADAKAVGDALATKLDKNQGTANAGKILGIGADGIVVPQDKPTYTLPQATADALGGIKADAATAEDTQVVRIGTDGKLRTKPSGSTVTVDDALSSTSTNPVQNKVVMAALAEKITAPTTATVGQIIKVKSVDESGKPTEWEAVTAKLANPNALTFTGAVTGSYDGSEALTVEIPSGGGNADRRWKLIKTLNVSTDVAQEYFDTDDEGNSFSVQEILITGTAPNIGTGYLYCRPSLAGNAGNVQLWPTASKQFNWYLGIYNNILKTTIAVSNNVIAGPYDKNVSCPERITGLAIGASTGYNEAGTIYVYGR